MLSNKIKYFSQLIRLDRPIGSLLLLWPTLWALWAAGNGAPQAKHVLIFIVGVFVTRSAGCIINDIADRKIDPHVARTKDRPLASGKLSVIEALAFFVVLVIIGLWLVSQLHNTAVWFSLGALAFIIIYPFLKRITNLPQFFLGATFSWAIPMSFAAETGTTSLVCWLLFIANLAWVTAYDTMYGMVDKPDDIKVGVKSTAILFGDKDITIICALNALAFLLLLLCGYLLTLSPYFYYVMAFAAVFFIYQYLLIRTRERDKCFRAFLNNNWFGASVFVAIVIGYLPL